MIVKACRCADLLEWIRQGGIDITPLLTHTFPLSRIEEAYDLFEHRRDGCMKIAIENL